MVESTVTVATYGELWTGELWAGAVTGAGTLWVVMAVGIREVETTVERAGQLVTSGPQLVMVILLVL